MSQTPPSASPLAPVKRPLNLRETVLEQLRTAITVSYTHLDVYKRQAFLSIADQQTSGIEVALDAAGIDPSTRYLTGTGGTDEAVEGIRSGAWKSTYAAFPVQRGAAALTQILNALNGEPVEAVVDADMLGDCLLYTSRCV